MTPDLPAVIAKLVAIERAGQTADLEIDIAEQCRGPADPLDRSPQYKYGVERFARIASRLLGLPYYTCRKAAIEAVLPSTRMRIALATIDEYYARLQGQVIQDFAAATLAKERRRRVRA